MIICIIISIYIYMINYDNTICKSTSPVVPWESSHASMQNVKMWGSLSALVAWQFHGTLSPLARLVSKIVQISSRELMFCHFSFGCALRTSAFSLPTWSQAYYQECAYVCWNAKAADPTLPTWSQALWPPLDLHGTGEWVMGLGSYCIQSHKGIQKLSKSVQFTTFSRKAGKPFSTRRRGTTWHHLYECYCCQRWPAHANLK